MAGLVVIYALGDPARYVGQSASPMRRLDLHVSTAFRVEFHRRTPVQHWLWDQLVSGAGMPPLTVLDHVPEAEKYRAEQAWIDRLQAEGAELLNVPHADRLNAAQRALQRKRMLGTTQTTEHRARISAGQKRAHAEGRRG